MKKLFPILIVVSILMVCFIGNSIAEDFTLHSGVTFGMTKEEVKEIEASKGFLASEISLPYTNYDEKGEYRAYVDKTKNNALSLHGSMAGISNSTLYYLFDENNKLFAAIYEFGDHDLYSYNEIQSLVDSKYAYGTKASEDKYKCPIDIDALKGSKTTYNITRDIYDAGLGITYTQVTPCSSRIFVPLDTNKRVYIAHGMFYDINTRYSPENNLLISGCHYLEYRIISTDELESIIDRIEGKTQRDNEKEQKEQEEKERQQQDDI